MAAKLVSGKSKAGGEDGIDAKLSQLVEARDDEGEQEAFRRGVIENICGKMLQGKLTLLNTVKKLGPLLTSDSTHARMQGVLVLVEVLRETKKVLTRHEINHILSFLCERLKDWHTLRATLLACKVLLASEASSSSSSQFAAKAGTTDREMLDREVTTPSPSPSPSSSSSLNTLTPENVKQLAQALFEVVDVQSHSQPIRHLSFEMMDILLRDPDHLKVLISMTDVDILEVLVRFLDGEKDPRCLLLAFGCVERSIHIFSRVSPKVVTNNAESVADVLSCYFPLSFSPPPDMMKSVTRQDLLIALFKAYTSTPEMFPHVVQLLADRFPSPKSETKVDGLTLLQMCLEKFATDITGGVGLDGTESEIEDLESLIEQVWDLIRSQILNTDPLLSVLDVSVDVMAKSFEALSSLAKLFGDSLQIVKLAFDDEDVKKALSCCSSKEDVSKGSKQQVMTQCRALKILATIASSSVFVFSEILSRTFDMTLENMSVQPVLLIHYVYHMTSSGLTLNQDGVSIEDFNGFSDGLLKICGKLLEYLAVNSRDAEDDYKTTTECIKALENCCNLDREWILMDLIEQIVMGLLDFSLAESQLPSEEHIVQIAKIISSIHLTQPQNSLMDKIIAKTLTALLANSESFSALMILSVIAEECTELSADIVLKLTKRAIESYDESMGANYRILSSILSKVSLTIMPHMYRCKSAGISLSVSSITKNLSVLLERILQSQEIEHGVLLHVLQSISYAILLCGEGVQRSYSKDAVALLLQEDLGSIAILDISESDSTYEGRCLLACAILNPFKSVDTIEQVEDVLHSILEGILGCQSKSIAVELSISLSGIINKLEKSQLDDLVLPLVRDVLLNHIKSSEDQVGVEIGFNTLSWITRALAMRKYTNLEYLLNEMFEILCSEEYEWDVSTSARLGESFSVIISTESDAMLDVFKWKTQVLWRQKLFTTLWKKLLAQFQNKNRMSVMFGLHKIFSQLIQSVPFTLLKSFSKDVVVNLIHSISILMQEDVLASRALMANLGMLKSALADDNMKTVVQDHVEEAVKGLISACGIGISDRAGAMLRKRALECVALLKNLPHYIIYPYFHSVRRQLQICLDDAKREVRLQAGITLRIWTEYITT